MGCLDLDEAGPKWVAPGDYDPLQRRTRAITGIAELVANIKSNERLGNVHLEPVTKTKFQIQREERKKHRELQSKEFNRQLSQWNPNSDPHIQGTNPNATVILARLAYTAKPEDIQTELSKYGQVERVRIVHGPNSPRGYAFASFSSPRLAKSMVEVSGGEIMLQGKRIIVDLERSRLQKGWKPRRLGGGEGGRFSLARQRVEVARHNNILRRGLPPFNQQNVRVNDPNYRLKRPHRNIGYNKPQNSDRFYSKPPNGRGPGGPNANGPKGPDGLSGSGPGPVVRNPPGRQLRQY